MEFLLISHVLHLNAFLNPSSLSKSSCNRCKTSASIRTTGLCVVMLNDAYQIFHSVGGLHSCQGNSLFDPRAMTRQPIMKVGPFFSRLPPHFPHSTRSFLLIPKMSQKHDRKGRKDHSRRENGPNKSSTVVLSKQLSWLLRHGLDKSGLEIRSDGYVRLDKLVYPFIALTNVYLSHPKFRQYTLDEIRHVVDTNDKQRFNITSLETPDGLKEFIRANQGHSIKAIKVEMEPITSPTDCPTVIHGTNPQAWALIAKDPKGLKRMGRNHIHFASGLIGEDGVISGMRYSATVLIYLDLEKALKDGIQFFRSENGVVLTEGVKGEGYLPKDYFSKAVTKKGEVLWPLDSDERTENVDS